MSAALEPSSQRAYKKAFSNFNSFQVAVLGYNSPQFPASVTDLTLYIAHLFEQRLSPATITSEISKLGYYHKLAGLADPSSVFAIKKMLVGARKLNPSLDLRLPITVAILHKLINALKFTTNSAYNRGLFQAMYLTAFHGFLRIGEITVRANNLSPAIFLDQVRFFQDKESRPAVEIKIINFKHNTKKEPFFIIIGSQHDALCGVSALQQYIQLRGHKSGPLFCSENNSAIHRDTFNKQLRTDLQFCKLDSSKYKGHSFRIGAASLAAANNISDAQIRLLGRWKSDAFKKYIRTPSVWSISATSPSTNSN